MEKSSGAIHPHPFREIPQCVLRGWQIGSLPLRPYIIRLQVLARTTRVITLTAVSTKLVIPSNALRRKEGFARNVPSVRGKPNMFLIRLPNVYNPVHPYNLQ